MMDWTIILTDAGFIARTELGDSRAFDTKRKAIDCAVWMTDRGIESYHPEVKPRDLRTVSGRESGKYNARDYSLVKLTLE